MKYFLLFIILFVRISVEGQNAFRETFDLATEKYRAMLTEPLNYENFPRSQNSNNEIKYVQASDWTSGFYPGVLWHMFAYSGDSIFLDRAKNYTSSLYNQKNNTGTHDLGFMMYLSYGNGYHITGDDTYADVLKSSAISLRFRFNAKIGCIRSWDFGDWQFPVIIDNMMNLELLFWTFKHTQDSIYYKMAVSHADVTMNNHFRSDYSSYHLVDYNKESGSPVNKQTFQGYSDESSWARGQAWGLYGYTMCYRETGLTRYLEQAENIAKYFLDNLPDDMIPYWDFARTEIIGEPRDASAAAIAASALLELAEITQNEHYVDMAKIIINNLSSDYYFDKKINISGNLLLKHSTGHKPHNSEINVPLIYADYYFIEALSRLIKMEPSTSNNRHGSPPSFNIYPNPASDHINIISGENLEKITILDINGKVVLTTNTMPSTINISQLNPGIYFLIGNTDKPDLLYRKKIIKL